MLSVSLRGQDKVSGIAMCKNGYEHRLAKVKAQTHTGSKSQRLPAGISSA